MSFALLSSTTLATAEVVERLLPAYAQLLRQLRTQVRGADLCTSICYRAGTALHWNYSLCLLNCSAQDAEGQARAQAFLTAALSQHGHNPPILVTHRALPRPPTALPPPQGAPEVQLHEPALATDKGAAARDAFESAYAQLAAVGCPIHVVACYDDLVGGRSAGVCFVSRLRAPANLAFCCFCCL